MGNHHKTASAHDTTSVVLAEVNDKRKTGRVLLTFGSSFMQPLTTREAKRLTFRLQNAIDAIEREIGPVR